MKEKIAFVVIGILTIIVIAMYYTNVKHKVPKIEELSPEQVSQKYYNSFSECMQHPPTEAKGQVSTYCQSHNPFGGKQLAENLTKQYAPVICGQNIPQAVSPTGTPKIEGTNATVLMKEAFSSGPVLIAYKLTQEHKQWKVANIECPKP